MSACLSRTDKRLLISIGTFALLLILLLAIFGPSSANNDTRPTTYNPGSDGAKAAFLTLQAMNVPTARWEKPLGELASTDATHTTLILADPIFAPEETKDLAAELKQYLAHGGRVLTTGYGGAELLGGTVAPAAFFTKGLCVTTPEGPGPLAAAGSVQFNELLRWGTPGVQYRVDQRCGLDPVVVHYEPSGGGEAIWWTSATPLSNAGLKDDANLRLFLASLGPDLGHGRRVVFDESLRTVQSSLWDRAHGLPLTWLKLQTALLAALLLFSFSRRRGPVRSPVTLPRSSPLEFAESMGELYAKAGANLAALGAARRRLDRLLLRDAGVAQSTLTEGPQAIAAALTLRLGGDWSALAQHLGEEQTAGDRKLTARSTLHLVRALHADELRLRSRLHPPSETPAAMPQPAIEAS